MSKRELIDAILQVNRSAAPEFLARFKETDLQAYLERVVAVTPRHRDTFRPTIDAAQQLLVA